MIKSWWAEKSTSEKQIVAALAVLSLGVFCWLGVIKPIDTYIAEHQSHAQKIKKDIKWMQDQASTHGLLGHPALTAKWHLNRSQFGIRIDHDLASISDHS
ncbi:type II secretion system protein GspM, partial [Escherichia coli]|nr:type II secretion system protein GspM [Escherichia coli]